MYCERTTETSAGKQLSVPGSAVCYSGTRSRLFTFIVAMENMWSRVKIELSAPRVERACRSCAGKGCTPGRADRYRRRGLRTSD